jgi:hypothetical protein
VRDHDNDVPLEEYSKGNLGDPDQPRCTLKQSSQQHDHVPFSCLKLVKSATCLRAEFASYLNDASSIGMFDSLSVESNDLYNVS